MEKPKRIKRARRVKDVLICILFLAPTLMVLSNTALASTSVTIKDCDINIVVNIAFYGNGAGRDLINGWEKSIEENYNGDGKRTFGKCACSVNFDVVTTIVKSREDCPRGYHCIEVIKTESDDEHISFVQGRLTHGKPVQNPDNSTTSTSSSLTGRWDTNDNGEVAGHEVGHLVGLEDEYKYILQNGREIYVNLNRENPDSKMARTWDNPKILQQHIDKIINKAGIKCPDKCCCGNGKIDKDVKPPEECDPLASPNGCPNDKPVCRADCKCYYNKTGRWDRVNLGVTMIINDTGKIATRLKNIRDEIIMSEYIVRKPNATIVNVTDTTITISVREHKTYDIKIQANSSVDDLNKAIKELEKAIEKLKELQGETDLKKIDKLLSEIEQALRNAWRHMEDAKNKGVNGKLQKIMDELREIIINLR